MKELFLTLTMLPLCLLVKSQNVNLTIPLPETSIKAAYLGSLYYPGFKFGIERPYQITQIDKTNNRGTKSKLKVRYLTANLGYYHHATFHDNFYLLIERQKRCQNGNGWFSEVAPGVGFSRTFLGGATYAANSNGEVSKKIFAGNNYAMLSASCGGGYNFAVKKDTPLMIYGKVSLLGIFPSNSFVYLRPTVEVGVGWSLSNFLKANPILKIKKK